MLDLTHVKAQFLEAGATGSVLFTMDSDEALTELGIGLETCHTDLQIDI